MGDLTFFLIVIGIGLVVIIGAYSYFAHHRKIKAEMQGFGEHAEQIDDVLLNHSQKDPNAFSDADLPSSFSTKDDGQLDVQGFSQDKSQNNEPQSSLKTAAEKDDFPLDPQGVEFVGKARVVGKNHLAREPIEQNTATQQTISAAKPNAESFKAQAPVHAQDKTAQSDFIADNKEDALLSQTSPKSSSIAQEPGQSEAISQPIAGQKITMNKMPLPEGVKDLIIAMGIKRAQGNMSGKEILTACQACNIQYGEMNIFHYPADDSTETYALFSIANMHEPGTFDLNNLEDFSTTGLSLFMQLPLPLNCLEAYDIFIEKSRLLAKFLNADLYDEKFNLITSQVISHNKEQINVLHHKMEMAKKKQLSN